MLPFSRVCAAVGGWPRATAPGAPLGQLAGAIGDGRNPSRQKRENGREFHPKSSTSQSARRSPPRPAGAQTRWSVEPEPRQKRKEVADALRGTRRRTWMQRVLRAFSARRATRARSESARLWSWARQAFHQPIGVLPVKR